MTEVDPGADHATTLIASDVTWMPLPNRIEEVLTAAAPPRALCSSAFVFVFDDQGRVLLALVRKRGLDLVGGHIDPAPTEDDPEAREEAAAAARRESWEETGATLGALVQVGYRRLHVADPPEGYRYPTPYSYQVYFAARLQDLGAVQMPEECGEPRLLTHEEALAEGAIQRHRALYEAARVEMGAL